MSSYGNASPIQQPGPNPDTLAGKLARLSALTERIVNFRNAAMLSMRGQNTGPGSGKAPTPAVVPNGLLQSFDHVLSDLDAEVSLLEDLRSSID